MSGTTDLLLWNRDDRSVGWTSGQVQTLPDTVAGAGAAAETLIASTTAEWWLFWDASLGSPPEPLLDILTSGRDDVLHAGLLLGTGGVPDDIDLIHPNWWFLTDPPADRRGTSWRLSLRACLARVDVVRALGGIDRGCATLDGAGLDMGWRYLARGAMVAHEPRLVAGPLPVASVDVPRQDRHLFLLRHYPRKWARYAMARRALGRHPWAEVRAFAGAARRCRAVPPPTPATSVYARPGVEPPDDGRVTVILPTLGRPDLVAAVLEDLRGQTVAPAEVICIDQNGTTDGGDPYIRFGDLPLQVIRQTERGQWLARNAAVERSTGDLLLFLDDDSRVGPDFIEQHLRGLATFRADVSAGASLSAVGAPVPANYGFFRAADQFDSGNAMVRREVLEEVGAFDRRYDRMRSGDADFGTRAYLAGGLLVHNPSASRVHLKAATGGLRTFGSWDSYRQLGLLTPRPLPSVVYYSLRYFSPRQTRESLLIGLAQSIVPYHLKRRASGAQWARAMCIETLTLPLSVFRVLRSVRAARRMIAAGPIIPAVPQRDQARRS